MLVAAAAPGDPATVYDAALHAQNSARFGHTKLYPGVAEALRALKEAGVRVVAYTESGAFWTEWRIRRTGLDGVIDVLYSAPDHDLLAGVESTDLRSGHYDDSRYGLSVTEHRHVPLDVSKPSQDILRSILDEEGFAPGEAAYLGDSLMKDIAMAQATGVMDIHAEYGLVQQKAEYDLLRRVTHWSDETVLRERRLARLDGEVIPSRVCRAGFADILSVFGLSRVGAL